MSQIERQKIVAYKGRTTAIRVDFKLIIDNVEYVMGALDQLIVNISGGTTPIRKVGTGTNRIIIAATDTDGLTASDTKYKWDAYLKVNSTSEEHQIIPISDFVLKNTLENGV